MNNKGFAITTIIFGTMILFLLLLVSLLAILSTHFSDMKKLIESENGFREGVTKYKNNKFNSIAEIREDAFKNGTTPESGLYCFGDECHYYGKRDLVGGITDSTVMDVENGIEYIEYQCTGTSRMFRAPKTGYYRIEAWGAQGGIKSSYSSANNNYGAYTSGYLYLSMGDKLFVYVGCTGDSINGGYNGGGSSKSGYGGGGGATDIRLISGAWDEAKSLNSRIMVAAGGAGSSDLGGNGSDGGAFGGGLFNRLAGQTPLELSTFGKGIDGQVGNNCLPGGGGGYYGGAAINNQYATGGTSFISGYAGVNAVKGLEDQTHTNNTLHFSDKYFVRGEMIPSVNAGNGRVKISFWNDNIKRTNTKLDNVRYIKDCVNGSNKGGNNQWVEIQAIADGKNVAYNYNNSVSVSGTATAVNANRSYSYILDGRMDNNTSSVNYAEATSGKQCVTIDLNGTYDLDEIGVWHYYSDNRVFYDNITYVSSDNTNWKQVIMNGAAETPNGKHVSAWTIEGRPKVYLRTDKEIIEKTNYRDNVQNVYLVDTDLLHNMPVHEEKYHSLTNDSFGGTGIKTWVVKNPYNNSTYDLYIGSYMAIYLENVLRTSIGPFEGYKSAINYTFNNFRTDDATSIRCMFQDNHNLRTLDLSNFNTSNVTAMQQVFINDRNLRNIDLTSFDTSKVKYLQNTFRECNNLEEIDLSSFDTSKVTGTFCMFASDSKLRRIYVSDKWTMANIPEGDNISQNSKDMFYGCGNLPGWNGVTNKSKAYAGEGGYLTLKE